MMKWLLAVLLLGGLLAVPVASVAGMRSGGGTTGRINHGNVNGLSGAPQATIMAWWYFTSISVNDTIFSGPENLFVVGATTDWRFSGAGAGGSPSVVPPPQKTWVHITFRFYGPGTTNDEKCQVFFNGVRQTASFLNGCGANLPSANLIMFGDQNSAGSFAGGIVAYLKAWKIALTPEQIQTEMAVGHPVTTENLVIFAPYHDGNPANDYSGNGNTGSVTADMTLDAGPPIPY